MPKRGRSQISSKLSQAVDSAPSLNKTKSKSIIKKETKRESVGRVSNGSTKK